MAPGPSAPGRTMSSPQNRAPPNTNGPKQCGRQPGPTAEDPPAPSRGSGLSSLCRSALLGQSVWESASHLADHRHVFPAAGEEIKSERSDELLGLAAPASDKVPRTAVSRKQDAHQETLGWRGGAASAKGEWGEDDERKEEPEDLEVEEEEEEECGACGMRHDESSCPNRMPSSEDDEKLIAGGAVGSDALVMTTLARGWWTPTASNGSSDVPQAARSGRPPAGGVIAVGQVGHQRRPFAAFTMCVCGAYVHKAVVLTEHAPCEQVIWAKLRAGRVAWWPGIVAQPVTPEQLAEAR